MGGVIDHNLEQHRFCGGGRDGFGDDDDIAEKQSLFRFIFSLIVFLLLDVVVVVREGRNPTENPSEPSKCHDEIAPTTTSSTVARKKDGRGLIFRLLWPSLLLRFVTFAVVVAVTVSRTTLG